MYSGSTIIMIWWWWCIINHTPKITLLSGTLVAGSNNEGYLHRIAYVNQNKTSLKAFKWRREIQYSLLNITFILVINLYKHKQSICILRCKHFYSNITKSNKKTIDSVEAELLFTTKEITPNLAYFDAL